MRARERAEVSMLAADCTVFALPPKSTSLAVIVPPEEGEVIFTVHVPSEFTAAVFL